MKSSPKVIEALNKAAQAELQAICQYKTHQALQKAAGYSRLSKRLSREHLLDEEKHLQKFMRRIIFLEGVPDISTMPELKIGTDIPTQFENDLSAEYDAISLYKESALLCGSFGDVTSQSLFEEILAEEEDHASDFEQQLSVINQTGLKGYLARNSHVEAK
jgi:bacterioferritin